MMRKSLFSVILALVLLFGSGVALYANGEEELTKSPEVLQSLMLSETYTQTSFPVDIENLTFNDGKIQGIQVETPIPGVSVLLDGVYQGKTSPGVPGINYLRVSAAPGKYSLQCEHPQYQPTIKMVTVPEKGFQKVVVQFNTTQYRVSPIETLTEKQYPKCGSLTVLSVPSGAAVVFEGRSLSQRTDVQIENIHIGTYKVEVSLGDLPELFLDVDVKEDQTVIVLADFEQGCISSSNSYLVNIDTEPSDATIFVDDQYVGRSPLELQIFQGIHDLRIEKPGYDIIHDEMSISFQSYFFLELKEHGAQVSIIPDEVFSPISYSFKVGETYFTQDDLPMINLHIPSSIEIPVSFNGFGSGERNYDLVFENDHIYTIVPLFPIPMKQTLPEPSQFIGLLSPPKKPTLEPEQVISYQTKKVFNSKSEWVPILVVGLGVLGSTLPSLEDSDFGVPNLVFGGIGSLIGFMLGGSLDPLEEEVKIITTDESVQRRNQEALLAWQSSVRDIESFNEQVIAQERKRVEAENSIIRVHNRWVEEQNRGRNIILITDLTTGEVAKLAL